MEDKSNATRKNVSFSVGKSQNLVNTSNSKRNKYLI
jgi:hypothetical protein